MPAKPEVRIRYFPEEIMSWIVLFIAGLFPWQGYKSRKVLSSIALSPNLPSAHKRYHLQNISFCQFRLVEHRMGNDVSIPLNRNRTIR